MPDQRTDPRQSKGKSAVAALFALIGTVGTAGLLSSIPQDEGTRYTAYRDVVGVETICSGDTHNVRPGMVETKAGCEERTARQILAHVEPVAKCIPEVRSHTYIAWALGSFAYNLGPGRVCKPGGVFLRAAAKRDWLGVCRAIRTPGFNTAGGTVFRGLELRRRREEQICITGLVPGATPDNLKVRIAASQKGV